MFQLLSTTAPHVAQNDTSKKTQLIGMLQLLSTMTPQVTQSDNNKKNATRWYVSAPLDPGAASRTERHQ